MIRKFRLKLNRFSNVLQIPGLNKLLMPNKTPKPENIPTYEELEKSIGMDKMSFMSEMLSEPGDTSKEEDHSPLSQIIGQSQEAEEEMPQQQPRTNESVPRKLPPVPGA